MLAGPPRFAGMWAEHEVEVRGPMLKHVNHPLAGPLEFECQVLRIAETGQRVIAYCAAPGSATEAADVAGGVGCQHDVLGPQAELGGHAP